MAQVTHFMYGTSSTYRADAFTSASATNVKEGQITAAIAAAVADGVQAVFVPQSMLPYNASLVTFNTAVRMIREGSDPTMWDVRAYGAAGDGSTNDTVAIQAAHNGAVAQSFAGTVFFSNLQYRAAELVINGTVRWLGDEGAEIRLLSAQSTGVAIVRVNTNYATTDLSDVTIENLGFSGDDQQISAAAAINARRTIRLNILGCRFRKFRGTGFATAAYCIYASGYSASQPTSPYPWGATAPAGWSQGTRILDCTFTDCGSANTDSAEQIFIYYHDSGLVRGCYGTNGNKLAFVDGWCRRFIIEENIIENMYDSGIRIQADDALVGTSPLDCQDCAAIGNVIRNVGRDGIRYSASRGSIVGNVCQNNALSGIAAVVMVDGVVGQNVCTANTGNGIHLVRTTITGFGTFNSVLVNNNTCRDNLGFGIRVEGGGDTSAIAASGIVVSSNRCGRNGNDGIRLSDCDDTCRVEGNSSYENGDGVITTPVGIRVEALLVNCGGVLIARNRCYEKRTGGAQRQVYGLWLLGNTGKTLSACYVEFNDFSDHLDITVPAGGSGRAARTTGGGGTTSPQFFIGNRYRNTNGTIGAQGVAAGALSASDIIIEMNETGEVALLQTSRLATRPPVTLTDAATVATDASLGNTFVVTVTAGRTMGAPTNPRSGQRITYTIIQGGAGAFAILWNAVFKKVWSDTGNAAAARSSISYIYDGTNWNQDGAQAPYV